MGNSGSINSLSAPIDDPNPVQSWSKVIPNRNEAIKVLPKDGLIGARLRSTNNGNILHSGGTLSGAKKSNIQRSKSITEPNFNHQRLMNRSQTQLDIIPRPCDINKYKNNNLIITKKIGSVPDLRDDKIQRGYTKKYRAPQQPLQQPEQSKPTVDYDPCRFGWKSKVPMEIQPRKLRLFKTRVESTRKLSEQEDINRLSDSIKKAKPNFFQFRREKSFDVSLLKPPPPPLPVEVNTVKTKSLKKIKENSKIQQKNSFQQELLAATIKRKNIEPISIKKPEPEPEKPEQPKTFYFGMDENQDIEIYQNSMNRTQLDEIDKFAESLIENKTVTRISAESSESALSSDCEDPAIVVDEDRLGGISLQLRPTLPKKQFEVPRFSPAAAWRQLSPSTDDQSRDWDISPVWDDQNSEVRIERIYREPIPGLPDNKSGDSGISGDAGLPERPESPKIAQQLSVDDLLLKNCENYLSAWTPQQDLGDDDDESCSDDYEPVKNQNNGHIFSLSLPREHIGEKTEKTFNSLQKLKRTVSGAFGQTPTPAPPTNDNWFLSRSAPNSIDNLPVMNNSSTTDEEIKPQQLDVQQINQPLIIKPNSFTYLKTGRHIMYLPNHTVDETSDYKLYDEKLDKVQVHKTYDKRGRENLQDPPASPKDVTPRNCKIKTGHRFTFQSTVRQIERKRLSEKLSKEAEQKEAQRLSELEAMRQVEEEFQKKRAREKATIRQQLRLYSLEENQMNSAKDFGVRMEPEGATLEALDDVNIKLNPTTEILSEFRTQRREYVEYRGVDHQTTELNQSTEYPIVYCNIPVYAGNSDNYRRHFARGISVGSSDSEMSHSSGPSPIGRNRTKRAQYRQRSPSPSGLY